MAKSILITGCSSGIGAYCARALKERGYRVFAGVRKQDDLSKLQDAGLEAVLIDLNETASIQNGLGEVLTKTGGKLDALFNNAGFLQAGAVEDISRDMDIQQFQTNVFGSMEMIRAALKVMRQQGHGRIIQNSSILGIIALAYCGSYNASKFALEGYCNTLRLELGNTPISISLINPGAVKSKLRDNAHQTFKANINEDASQHQAAYTTLKEEYFSANRKKDPFSVEPDVILKSVIHALESRRPKAHYYPGAAAKIMSSLHRLLPDVMMDQVLAKVRGS